MCVNSALHTMTNLDLFLQKGPQGGDVTASLEELRQIVLLDGIPANNDGTVGDIVNPLLKPN